jgi:HEAT repeat protein
MSASTLILSIVFLTLLYIPGYTQTISGPGFAAAMRIEPAMAKKIGYLRKIGINGLQPVEGIDGLIATLKDANEPPVIRVEAARAIGRVGDASAIATLQEASIIPSETIQLILSGFFDKKGITPNPDEIINANGEVGAAAIVALERLYSAGNDTGLREGLLNLIQYSNAPVKREAALALAEAGDERALQHLKDLGLAEAHEKLKLLLEMKDTANVDRANKLITMVKTAPSTTEEAAKRGAAISILADIGEAALPTVAAEIDRLGKKNRLASDEIKEFIDLSTVVLSIGSDKSVPVFEKLQSHSDMQISELSKIAISFLKNGVPAVIGGPTFSGRGLLKKNEAGVLK